MKETNRLIFLLALLISMTFHFFLFKLSPEVRVENRQSADQVIRFIKAIVVEELHKPDSTIIKNIPKKVQPRVEKVRKKKPVNKNVATLEGKNKVREETTFKRISMPKKRIDKKLRKVEETLEKMVTPDESKKEVVIKNKERFIPFYRVDRKPTFIQRGKLTYPRRAKELGLEGIVILEADIDEKGKIINVRVVKKAGFGFDEAALKMIKESRFTPAYSVGKPVPVRMRFTIEFSLE